MSVSAIAMPIIDHRSAEFAALGRHVLEGSKTVFQTKQPVVIYPSSGTGAWEAAIGNTLSPGDTVLMAETGHFATLWKQIATRFADEPTLAEANLAALDAGHAFGETAELQGDMPSFTVAPAPLAPGLYRTITGGEHYLPAQIRQAQVMSKQGDLPGARQFLHKVNAQTNQQRVQLIIAESQLLRDANQPKEAFDVVGSGLDKLPNDPDLLYDYAMLAEKLK